MEYKKFLTSALFCSSLFIAFAEDKSDLSVKVGGSVGMQYGSMSQQKDFKNKLDTSDQYRQNALSNTASLKFHADKKNKEGLKYGAFVKLHANTTPSASGNVNIANEVKLYVDGGFGKVEMGSTGSVGGDMEVNSYTIARATGGLDGDWSLWPQNGDFIAKTTTAAAIPKTTDYGFSGAFLTAPQLPIGFDESTKAVKINYYTPEINGFTFGISYSPDSEAKGTVSQAKGLFKNSGSGYKNVFQPTAKYVKKFENGTEFSTALLGQFGKAKAVSIKDVYTIANIDNVIAATKKRKNLSAWQIGASVSHSGFAVAGSYGDWGKSGSIKDTTNPDHKFGGKYWSIGSAYSQDDYGISLNYMKSKRAGHIINYTDTTGTSQMAYFNDTEYNKFDALSIGADYTVMPGFMPYVEVTKFKYNKSTNFGADAKFNKGTVLLLGTKIEF